MGWKWAVAHNFSASYLNVISFIQQLLFIKLCEKKNNNNYDVTANISKYCYVIFYDDHKEYQ